MNRFTYLITEGVLDAVFLTGLLCHQFGHKQVQALSELPQTAQDWIGNFKWPLRGDIRRMSVPAPVFLKGPSSLVAIRNSQGLKNIISTLNADFAIFLRIENGWFPESLCVLLDADDEPPEERFEEFAPEFQVKGFPRPMRLGLVTPQDGKRSGVFSFPGHSKLGTIEDVLIPLARKRFGSLIDYADSYVGGWRFDKTVDFKDLAKPSGPKKALLSAMVSLLKPGKNLNASIEDQDWISDSIGTPELKPLVDFLSDALDLRSVPNSP